MDYSKMKRKELQALCKKNLIPANLTNREMADRLASLIKGNGNPKAPGPSCLKNLSEVIVIEDSDGESKPSKKVKFTSHNDLFEFTKSNPRENRRITRRTSMFLKNQSRATVTGNQYLLDDGLVPTTNNHVEEKIGSKSKIETTKIDEPKLPRRRLTRKRELVPNDAVSSQNQARVESNEEAVNESVRVTRSRIKGSVDDGYVSSTSSPVEKRKGRKANAAVHEVKAPIKRMSRNRKGDHNGADSVKNHAEDVERLESNVENANNRVRVTRSRTERSVDEDLASTTNPPVKMRSGIVEISKSEEVLSQNQAEDTERVQCKEEIVKKIVRVTRSRTQGSVDDGIVSTMNPPVGKKKGRKLRNAVCKVDEVNLPTERLLRNRKEDQNGEVLIQNHVEDVERFESSKEIANNRARVTRSRTERSADVVLASTTNPPVQMKTVDVDVSRIEEVLSKNQAVDAERIKCNVESVNKAVRLTRSRTQGSVDDGSVSAMSSPVEKKKGSKLRKAVSEVDEVKLPAESLLRSTEEDQNGVVSVQNHVEDVERVESNEENANNRVRVTRSRTEQSIDEGLASITKPPVKLKTGRYSIVEIIKVSEIPSQNQTEDAERVKCNEETVNKSVRITRSRTQDSVDGGIVSIMSPDEKKKGRKSVAEINEMKLPTRSLLRDRKGDQNGAESIESHAEDVELLESKEKTVNNRVRVTRSGSERSVDEGLASNTNLPAKMKPGRKSIVEICEVNEILSQNQTEDAERVKCNGEIVNNAVRVTRSRTQDSVDDGFVSIMSPVEKKKGRKSVAEVSEMKLPAKSLLKDRKEDQNGAESIETHAEEAGLLESKEKTANNSVGVTRSGTERSVDEGLASTMSGPVKMRPGRKSIVESSKVEEVLSLIQTEDVDRVNRNEEIVNKAVRVTRSRTQDSVDDGFVSMMSPPTEKKKGRKPVDEVKSATEILLRSRKEDQNASESIQNHIENVERFESNEKTVNNQVRVTRSRTKQSVDEGNITFMSDDSNIEEKQSAGVPKRNVRKWQRSRRKVADAEKIEKSTADILDGSRVMSFSESLNLENPVGNEEKLDQDYATEEVEYGPTVEVEGTEIEKDRLRWSVNMEKIVDKEDNDSMVNVCADIDQASFKENAVAKVQEANDTTKYVEISSAQESLECNTSSRSCAEYITEVSEMTIGPDNDISLMKNSESAKNDVEDSYVLGRPQCDTSGKLCAEETIENEAAMKTEKDNEFVEEGLNDQGCQEKVEAKEKQDEIEKNASILTTAEDKIEENTFGNKQVCEPHLLSGSSVVQSTPCEEKEASSDEKLTDLAILLNKEIEGLKEIEQNMLMHDAVEGVSRGKTEVSVQETLSCEEMNLGDNVIQNLSNMEESLDHEKHDLVELSTNDDSLKLTNHEGTSACSLKTSMCDSAEGEYKKLPENDDKKESTEDMATEEHAGEPHLLMLETAAETSLHDNVVLEHSGSVSDDFGISSDLHSSSKATNEIVQGECNKVLDTCSAEVNQFCEGESEEMCGSDENEHRKNVACEATVATSEDNSREYCDEPEQDDQPTNSSPYLEQELANQDSMCSNSVQVNNFKQPINETSETSLKIAETFEFIEDNTKGIEDSTVCYKSLDNVSDEDTLVARIEVTDTEALLINDESDLFEPADNKDITNELPVEESVYDSQSDEECEKLLESDDNGESTEDMATEEHAEKPDHLMEATAEETTSLHDNIVLEHPVSVSDFGTSSDLHSSLNVTNEIVQVLTTCSAEVNEFHEEETEEMYDKVENEHAEGIACEATPTSEENSVEACDYPKQDEQTNSSLHLEQKMANQETDGSNAVKFNNIEQPTNETIETSLKIVEKVVSIEENKKVVEDSTAADEDTLVATDDEAMMINYELDSLEPDDNKDISIELSDEENVSGSQSDVSISDFDVSSDLHSLNVMNGIDQVLTTCSAEVGVTEEMCSKDENEQMEDGACEAAANSEDNRGDGCGEPEQDDQLYVNNKAHDRSSDEEDNDGSSNERWHEEDLVILFATPGCENNEDREARNSRSGKWDKTPEKVGGEETFNPGSSNILHGTTEAAQDDLSVSSQHLEQEMVNQGTVADEDTLVAGKKATDNEAVLINYDSDSFEPDGNKGTCTQEQAEPMVKVLEDKINEFQELVQNCGNFNAFTGSAIRVVKHNFSKTVARFSFEDEELNSMFATPMDNQVSMDDFIGPASKSGGEHFQVDEFDNLNAQDIEVERRNERAPSAAKLTPDNRSCFHDQELVNQDMDDEINEEFPKSVQEVQALEKNKKGNVDAPISEDGILCNQDPLDVLDGDSGTLNLESKEEQQRPWEELSEASIFENIQGHIDGISDAAEGTTRESSNDRSDDFTDWDVDLFTEDGEFDEVNQPSDSTSSLASGVESHKGKVQKDLIFNDLVDVKNQTAKIPNDIKCNSTTMKVKTKSTLVIGTPNKLFVDMKENARNLKKEAHTENISEAKGIAKRRALGQI